MLSEFRLWDGSAYPLAALLIGRPQPWSILVRCCWWWLAGKDGQSSWGTLAMQASEFMGFLDDSIKEISSRQTAGSGEFSESLI
jgi:hypothetical protein